MGIGGGWAGQIHPILVSLKSAAGRLNVLPLVSTEHVLFLGQASQKKPMALNMGDVETTA